MMNSPENATMNLKLAVKKGQEFDNSFNSFIYLDATALLFSSIPPLIVSTFMVVASFLLKISVRECFRFLFLYLCIFVFGFR